MRSLFLREVFMAVAVVGSGTSSETQGQIKGARESLNGRRRSGFWLVPEKHNFSGTNQKPERRRPFGTGLVRHCPQGLFSPFFTFLRATFSRPFRLSLVPPICPWVSEDGSGKVSNFTSQWRQRICIKKCAACAELLLNQLLSRPTRCRHHR